MIRVVLQCFWVLFYIYLPQSHASCFRILLSLRSEPGLPSKSNPEGVKEIASTLPPNPPPLLGESFFSEEDFTGIWLLPDTAREIYLKLIANYIRTREPDRLDSPGSLGQPPMGQIFALCALLRSPSSLGGPLASIMERYLQGNSILHQRADLKHAFFYALSVNQKDATYLSYWRYLLRGEREADLADAGRIGLVGVVSLYREGKISVTAISEALNEWILRCVREGGDLKEREKEVLEAFELALSGGHNLSLPLIAELEASRGNWPVWVQQIFDQISSR